MSLSAAQSDRLQHNHSTSSGGGIGTKNYIVSIEPNRFSEPKFKFVKKARMWCKTWFEGKDQKQEWLSNGEYSTLKAGVAK